jgi:hypothetical protein
MCLFNRSNKNLDALHSASQLGIALLHGGSRSQPRPFAGLIIIFNPLQCTAVDLNKAYINHRRHH